MCCCLYWRWCAFGAILQCNCWGVILIVFSFLCFGSFFRVCFLERPLLQLGILNLHAIGNKPGNLFYGHFVFWPVAEFSRPPMFSTCFRPAMTFCLSTGLSNEGWEIRIAGFNTKVSNPAPLYIPQWYLVIRRKSLSFRRSHIRTKPNMCKLLIYTALQMLLDAEKVNWRFSLWVKLNW